MHHLLKETLVIWSCSKFVLFQGKLEEIFQNLTKGAAQNGNFTVYKREDIPAHFHYNKNRRIPPILAVAKDHFSFVTDKEPVPACEYFETKAYPYLLFCHTLTCLKCSVVC